jgi:hypothetical protein
MRSKCLEYADEVEAALADPALWIVKGVERVAFDAKVDMPVIQSGCQLIQLGTICRHDLCTR